MTQRVSVTVLTGSTGTTGSVFFDQMLQDVDTMRVTAIVPAQGKKKTKVKGGISLVPTTERFARLGQGCSCCTVRSDLMTKIKRIAADQSADHVVVQVPPKGDLEILGKTFSVADNDGLRLGDVARLQTVITVIDGRNMLANLESGAARSLIERVELASMVGIEGASELTTPQYNQVVHTVKALNPDAQIIRDDDTAVTLKSLNALPTNDKSQTETTNSSCEIPGIGTAGSTAVVEFSFHARRPFHPGRFNDLINTSLKGVLRAQGTFWLASQPDHVAALDIAAGSQSTYSRGLWWATVAEDRRPDSADFQQYVKEIWHPEFGDRHQNISIVGLGIDETQLTNALEACLLTEAECAEPEKWSSMPHPFPWPAKQA